MEYAVKFTTKFCSPNFGPICTIPNSEHGHSTRVEKPGWPGGTSIKDEGLCADLASFAWGRLKHPKRTPAAGILVYPIVFLL